LSLKPQVKRNKCEHGLSPSSTVGRLVEDTVADMAAAGAGAGRGGSGMGKDCVKLCMTPIGQPYICQPMAWLYFLFGQSVFVFVGWTRSVGGSTGGGALDACAALDPMNELHVKLHIPALEAADGEVAALHRHCAACKDAMCRVVCSFA
jgi:hypothetical protein